MRTFRIVLILAWCAVALNLILSASIGWYRYHVSYGTEGLLFLVALLLWVAYKVTQLYKAGMNQHSSR